MPVTLNVYDLPLLKTHVVWLQLHAVMTSLFFWETWQMGVICQQDKADRKAQIVLSAETLSRMHKPGEIKLQETWGKIMLFSVHSFSFKLSLVYMHLGTSSKERGHSYLLDCETEWNRAAELNEKIATAAIHKPITQKPMPCSS